MKQFLIIPQINSLEESLSLANEYSMGFEYNDFFSPDTLDDSIKIKSLTDKYKSFPLPEYCTMHGDFFDVIVYSLDSKIREISAMRVEQSIQAATDLGVKGIVFHSNFNPFFTSTEYIEKWADDNGTFWSGILEKYPDLFIYIENMFDRTPDALRLLSERLCGYENFGICFDYAHAALCDIPHSEWLDALGKYVKHIHINDNDLKTDLHLAVGDGKIDWTEFYRSYEKYMAGATVLIETSSLENQRRSVLKLKKDGFLE